MELKENEKKKKMCGGGGVRDDETTLRELLQPDADGKSVAWVDAEGLHARFEACMARAHSEVDRSACVAAYQVATSRVLREAWLRGQRGAELPGVYRVIHVPPSLLQRQSTMLGVLMSMTDFYLEHDHLDTFTRYTAGAANHISLRMLDWLVTNYAPKYDVTYGVPDARGVHGETTINLFQEYKGFLCGYSKMQFDPFCRRQRRGCGDSVDEGVRIRNARGEEQVTTVGQLNFFRWAIRRGVLEYAERNRAAIEAHNAAYVTSRGGKARSRAGVDVKNNLSSWDTAASKQQPA